MKNILLFLIILIPAMGFGQMPDIEIELNTDSAFLSYNFSCHEIIDARSSKENIGKVSRGIGSNNSNLIIKGDSSDLFAQIFRNLTPNEVNKPNIVLIIKNILASENIGTQNQFGYCNVEIEFAKRRNSILLSLGTFYASVGVRTTKAKYTHGERVVSALEKCLEKFNTSDWQSLTGTEIDLSKEDTVFDYSQVPPKGAYFNYKSLKGKAPFNAKEMSIIQTNKSTKFAIYKIKFDEEVNSKLVGFVSDGKDIYMRLNDTHFLKSESYGRYIFFRGKIPTAIGNNSIDRNNIKSPNTTDVAVIATAAVIIGITAGIMGGGFFIASPMGNNNNVNTSLKGVVIDTETDELKVVTDMFLHRITKPYPLMLKEYRKSKRKPEDKREVIEALNAKF